MLRSSRSDAVAAASGVEMMHIPLESLRAEAAEQFRSFKHVLIVCSKSGTALNADRRCWQACVRLRRVFGLQQAAILDT